MILRALLHKLGFHHWSKYGELEKWETTRHRPNGVQLRTEYYRQLRRCEICGAAQIRDIK